jgi:multiple antibiotic resistance protein
MNETGLIETAVMAFTTFFATLGPIDVAATFAVLTARASRSERWSMAVRGVLTASGILFAFALSGETVLRYLGISLPALRTAGGILLLLIAIDMAFARSSGGVSTTEAENREAAFKDDIAVFPLATPLIAGPGAMSAVVLLMTHAQQDFVRQSVVLAALLAVLLLTFAALIAALQIQRLLGLTGLNVISRIFGVLLAGLAVQFMFDGIAASGLFS